MMICCLSNFRNITVNDDEALKFAEVSNDFFWETHSEINFNAIIDFFLNNKKRENQVD
jgi:glucosamine-6-phosphate deaminase